MYTKEFEFPAKTVFANNSDNVSSTKWSFTLIVPWIFDFLSQQPEFENQIFVFFGGDSYKFLCSSILWNLRIFLYRFWIIYITRAELTKIMLKT